MLHAQLPKPEKKRNIIKESYPYAKEELQAGQVCNLHRTYS